MRIAVSEAFASVAADFDRDDGERLLALLEHAPPGYVARFRKAAVRAGHALEVRTIFGARGRAADYRSGGILLMGEIEATTT